MCEERKKEAGRALSRNWLSICLSVVLTCRHSCLSLTALSFRRGRYSFPAIGGRVWVFPLFPGWDGGGRAKDGGGGCLAS